MKEVRRLVHLMRLGVHSEQMYFAERPTLYDILVLNAHVAEYTAKGSASFVVGRLQGRKFLIDPSTHAFAHHPRFIMTDLAGEGRVKKSIAALAERYGEPVSSLIGERALTPDDFKSDKVLESFTRRVLDFQRTRLESAVDEDLKYFDASDVSLRPCLVVAPYFHMASTDFRQWLPVNIRLIEAAQSAAEGLPLYSEIVIDKGLLDDPEEFSEICQEYVRHAPCVGFLIWISGLSEHEAGVPALRHVRDFIASLASAKRPIYNLYGGYFSLLLHHAGLAGVCHGPGYGEERNVVPVGGGVPVAKYYLTPVHQRMLHRDVQLMISAGAWRNADDFQREVCAGETCREVLAGDLSNFSRFGEAEARQSRSGRLVSVLTGETRSYMVFHYLEAKASEFEQVQGNDLPSLIGQLRSAYARYESLMPGLPIRHLDNWARSLA